MISDNSVDFDHMPVVRDPRDFDVKSGNALDREFMWGWKVGGRCRGFKQV